MNEAKRTDDTAKIVHMDNQSVKRKLAAILSTDVKDYTRLMANDEVETINSIKTCRKLISQKVIEHHGRVVDSPGDNILSEFASVTNAVECAVEIQGELTRFNEDLPDNRKMKFRIGINLGDIIEDSQRIYGDGINIAARLEGVADGGGICISGSAYDQVKNRLALGYEFLGDQSLKNIPDPVPVYRVLTDPKDAGKLKYKCIKDSPKHKIGKRIIGLLILLLIIGGGIALKKHSNLTPADHRKMFKQKLMSLKIPDKPSIAVLPFMNMSGDKEQEYFSDGLTEDLITDLSKISGLFVISRNSAFAYKGKSVKVDEIGKELGVKYVLEGSVRKIRNQVRITAQLIDTISGGHLWAERYDRDMNDIFSLQDEVRQKIVEAMAVQITSDDQKRIMHRGTQDPEAYDIYLKAKEFCEKKEVEDLIEGRQLLEKVIYLDPNFAKAYSHMAKTYFSQWIFGDSKEPAILEKVLEWGKKAIAVNADEPSGYSQLAHYYLWTKQHDTAIEEIQKALDLDPNNSEWLASYGELLTYAGEPEKGIDYLKKALRLDPKYPVWYLYGLGHAYYLTENHDQAIATFEKAVEKDSGFWPSHLLMALSYHAKGMDKEAKEAVKKTLDVNPNLANENWENIIPYKDPEAKQLMVIQLKEVGFYK